MLAPSRVIISLLRVPHRSRNYRAISSNKTKILNDLWRHFNGKFLCLFNFIHYPSCRYQRIPQHFNCGCVHCAVCTCMRIVWYGFRLSHCFYPRIILFISRNVRVCLWWSLGLAGIIIHFHRIHSIAVQILQYNGINCVGNNVKTFLFSSHCCMRLRMGKWMDRISLYYLSLAHPQIHIQFQCMIEWTINNPRI